MTYINWENGKRQPELNKVVELAGELNATVDYLLGNTDMNLLDITKENLDNLPSEKTNEIMENLSENVTLIFEVAKVKFNLNDDEIEGLKTELRQA